MYIAFEGVKGVGKTTLFQKISEHLSSNNVLFTEATPTRPIGNKNILERLVKIMPSLRKIDLFKEYLYAMRSNYVARTINWEMPLVLGDRSIATSYVTRLWRFQNPILQIERVDKIQPLIPAPDYIFYLEADTDIILSRILNRQNRNYGKEDEKASKIIQDIKAYNFLMHEKPSKRLSKTQWIKIDASQTAEKVFNEAIEKLSCYAFATL